MASRKKPAANQPKPDEDESSSSAHESAENEGMAHVRADELAGSPDIFAPSSQKTAAGSPGAASSPDEPESVAEPESTSEAESAAEAKPVPESESASVEPEREQAALEAHVEPDAAPVTPMPPPPAAPAPPTFAPAPGVQPSRAGSGVALGIVLVVVGLFFLAVRLADVDLGAYGWPLFIVIPGLTLLIVGFVSLGTGAAIPGGILTMVGLVLAYQNSSGNWASWVYVWPLVAPGGVGVGLFLQGMRDRNQGLIKQGRSLIFIAFLIFMIGFVFFESILHLTGTDYGLFGKVALPGLLVVIGIVLLMRSLQRSRTAP